MNRKKTFTRFEDWNAYDLQTEFGWKLVQPYPAYLEWIKVEGKIPPQDLAFLQRLRLQLIEHQHSWNETDLLMKFIGPLLTLIEFTGSRYDNFGEVKLAFRHANHEVSGFVDWLVATGRYEPQTPFFFLHEYKRIKFTNADPLGQLLIAMKAAQVLNENTSEPPEPIYGCFVIGKLWQFILLNGTEYGTGAVFDATDEEELTHIYLILQKTKQIIEERVARLPVHTLFESL